MTQNVYPLMGRTLLPFLLMSFVSNLAILISPLFMMQVLDRVIPSGNLATLALLGALAVAAYSLQAIVDATKDLSLGRLSRWTEKEGTAFALAPGAKDQNAFIQQVAGFANFLSGPAANAALSAPWIPFFLFVLMLLHPAFLILLFSMLSVFAVLNAGLNALSRPSKEKAQVCAQQEISTLDQANIAEDETGIAVLAQNLRLRFAAIQHVRHTHLDDSEIATVSKNALNAWIRNVGQVSALAVGAWLVTIDAMSAGGMIAGSIITSRAYMVIEGLISQLPSITLARSHYAALCSTNQNRETTDQIKSEPSGTLRAENLLFPKPGGAPPRLDRVSFELKEGECLAIVGSAGSGKTTLLRALSGSNVCPIGSVFLGESEISSLSRRSLFDIVGYLPQRTTFRSGTMSENISCFAPNPIPEDIVEAAKIAGVHGLISALPNGYETDIGDHPHLLTAGQLQRVALARAIFSKPKYLFLDEPNALLDAEGERALGQSLLRLKKNKTTIVMSVHRSGILVLADKVMQLDHGRISDFGPKSEVLGRLSLGGRRIELPILETSSLDLRDWIASQFTRAGDETFKQQAQRVGGEMLNVACNNCPPDTLNFANFEFVFLDETTCELKMLVPALGSYSMDSIQPSKESGAKPNKSRAFDLTEKQFANLTNCTQTLDVSSAEKGTLLKAVLKNDDISASANGDLERIA